MIKRLIKAASRLTSSGDARLKLLKMLPPNGVGGEIGVWKGDFSAQILEVARPRSLHLIDPWLFQNDFPQRWYGGAVAKNQADMDKIADSVAAGFAGDSRVKIHRNSSVEALKEFADEHFDWIYIDGDHGYDAVLLDLVSSLPKVRRSGILCGDDYDWKEGGEPVVEQAVARFIAENNAGGRLHVEGNQFLIKLDGR